MMKTICAFLLSLLLVTNVTSGAAEILLHFDADDYNVASEGEFQLQVLIDGNYALPDDQPVANGLFSYGFKLLFPAESAKLVDSSVSVATELDYNGFVDGAAVTIGDSCLTLKGNIALSNSESYTLARVVTVTFKCTAPAGETFSLQLVTAQESPRQSLFVDGKGNALDANIRYSRAVVRVEHSHAAPTAPPLRIRKVDTSRIRLLFSPVSGRNHFVDVSEDLRAWTPLSSSPINGGISDVGITQLMRYFRLRIE